MGLVETRSDDLSSSPPEASPALAPCGRLEGQAAHESAILALRAAEGMYERLAAHQALACALEKEGDRPAAARVTSEVVSEARRLGFQTLSL